MVILQKRVSGLTEGILERFVTRARRAAGLRGRVNIVVTSSAAVRRLNREFRHRDEATDVLSFPSSTFAVGGRKARLAGEIAISADIAAQNSASLGHSVAEEIKILALHGILHLAGFDHERDNGEMAGKEARLRRALRLPTALIERSQPARGSESRQRRRVQRVGRTA